MDFSVKSGHPEKQRVACVIVGVFDRRKLSEAGRQIDKASGGVVSNIMRRGDMDGSLNQSVMLYSLPNTFCDRVLLIGCGKEKEFTPQKFRQVIEKSTKIVNQSGAKDAVTYLTDLSCKGQTVEQRVHDAVSATLSGLYLFDQCKQDKKRPHKPLCKLILNLPSRRDLAKGEAGLATGLAVGEGINLARDLSNLPGNICTPTYLANQAKKVARGISKLKVQVLEEADMEKLGMGALLSVSRGSRENAKLIVMEYTGGRKNSAPHVLVGKGLTFDAGGISLKPAAAMDEMKYDMCGGASVIGTMKAIAKMGLKLNVVGIVPSSENLPDGAANKPGDIVTSMSGQTIEIINTDAEGRLILCDALTFSEKYNPATVIDIATLTGACVIALGSQASGLFTQDTAMAKQLIKAGNTTGDRVWEMPLWDDYQPQLKSPFADMSNVGGREAGSITAACFLARYTKKFRWAHLDIAGTAWKSGADKGATGRPVATLVQYLRDQAKV